MLITFFILFVIIDILLIVLISSKSETFMINTNLKKKIITPILFTSILVSLIILITSLFIFFKIIETEYSIEQKIKLYESENVTIMKNVKELDLSLQEETKGYTENYIVNIQQITQLEKQMDLLSELKFKLYFKK